MPDKKTNLKHQHRDTLFRAQFKIPKHFLDLLKHCRQSNSSLTVDDIKPFDLDSAITTRIRRNDVSFITKDNRLIILVEHQSTINPNMAFRLLLYYIELLQLWIELNCVDLYRATKVKDFPVPEFYVAYNGSKPPDSEFSIFNLHYEGMKIDVSVKIVDIHFENLSETTSDNALAGYSYFYKLYDEGVKGGVSNEAAFNNAREKCIEQGYFNYIEKEDFVMFYKNFLDYDTQLISQGKAEGVESSILIAIQNNVPFHVIEMMAKQAGISPHRLDELLQQAAV